MQAIKKILKTEKGKVTVDIPEYFGGEVEVIILPVTEINEKSSSYQMMKCQEKTGFANKVLGSDKEDVWNEV